MLPFSGAQKGGSLSQEETVLQDRNRNGHSFNFETFFNRHMALTLGYWIHLQAAIAAVQPF